MQDRQTFSHYHRQPEAASDSTDFGQLWSMGLCLSKQPQQPRAGVENSEVSVYGDYSSRVNDQKTGREMTGQWVSVFCLLYESWCKLVFFAFN